MESKDRKRRLSRRALLGMGGAGAASAALYLAGCGGGGSSSTPTSRTGGTGTAGPAGTTTTSSSPTQGTPGAGPDPALSVTGYVFSDEQFDPHKTQVGTLHGQQAFVYSRLLSYADQAQGTLVPDLAMDLPEQPDSTTYVFRINPAAQWQPVDPLNGRRVTAEDVKYSLERQINGDSSFIRKARWLQVESIDATSPEELVIKTKSAFAPMLSRLAEPGSFIVSPEHDSGIGFGSNQQVGSGPFQWVEWDELKFASVVRNEVWHGEPSPLSGVTIVQPRDAEFVEASLRVRDVDVAYVGTPTAERLKQNIPDLNEQRIGNALFFGMRFFTQTPPFNHAAMRSALSLAVDRQNMLDVFFAGSGEANPWVSWPVSQWSLPQSELSTQPGFRRGSAAREQDIADAKAMLASLESDGIEVPKRLSLFSEISSEQQLSVGSLVARHVWEALGIEVKLEYLPIEELVSKAFSGEAQWIAGPDTGWLDLDDWVYQYFHSTGVQNSFALRDSNFDALLEKQRAEFNVEARQQLGYDIQRRLLGHNYGVNFVSERISALSWPYVRNFPLDITDGYQDRFARCWIDTEDPSWRPR